MRKRTGDAKSKLNELVGNFESDIARLQAQIAKERMYRVDVAQETERN